MLIRHFLFNLDDRLKIWMAASSGAAAIYSVDWRLQAAVLGVCLTLCLLCGAKWFVAGFMVAVSVLAIFCITLAWAASGRDRIPGPGVFFILLKFGPLLAMMVFVQASLNTSRFLRSLEHMRLPRQWVIPLGVCLRFMPSVAAECRQIRCAMRIRGIGLTPGRLLRRPFETVSYMMAPLLARSIFIGDELARAAVARGIEAPGVKTSFYDLDFRLKDAVVAAVWTLAIIILLIADHQIFEEIARRMP